MSVRSPLSRSLCMIPGPVEFHEDVLAQMACPATSHVDPAFVTIFGESIELLREVLMAKSSQPFIIAGSGTLGWDQVACNLVESSEPVLVINTGLFGDRFGECLEAYGASVSHLRCPVGTAPTLADIENALAQRKFKVVTVTHVDTSTGVLVDIKSVAALVKKVCPDALFVVDGVCSVGGEEIRMDEWGIDIVLTASQKALGVPPGLCVLLASLKAMDVFKSRKTPITGYYASWAKWTPIMNAYEARKPSYFATPPVQLIIALHTSLKQILAVPLKTRFEDHKTASRIVKDILTKKWRLKLVPQQAHAANTLSAVYYPPGVAASDLLPKLTSQGIVVAGGLHPQIATKYFRIGHMGLSVTEPKRGYITRTIEALEKALLECGVEPSGLEACEIQG